MKRWLQRLILISVACFIAIYMGDWAIFRLRGTPTSKITVNRYLTVPLKGNKQEFDYLGSVEVTCAISLFPQGALSPCWQVRREASQNVKL